MTLTRQVLAGALSMGLLAGMSTLPPLASGVAQGAPTTADGALNGVHLRTTNPIESTFATVRLRTRVTKGPGSRAAGVAMAYKLMDMATSVESWRSAHAGDRTSRYLTFLADHTGYTLSDVEKLATPPAPIAATAPKGRQPATTRQM